MLSMMNNFEKNLNAHEQRMLILEKSLLKFEKEILNPLSQNKKTFLENPEYLYQMHASDLFALTDHYWKKNIPIIFNGATPEKYALILKKNEALPAEKQDIGLTGDEIFDEMLHIQNLLKKNNDSRFIGYISTNGVIKTKKHFDYFIISKDEIMLPVFYDISFNIRDRSHSKLLRYYIYKSNLHGFGGSGLHPQADSTSCGSLGLASLKKLLQNDAYELKNRTLSVRFYDKNEILRSYFFTSPKVLQFSQSSKFNQALKDLLMNDEET
ncbi:MAG TPA: hypothetical protein VHM20_08055, partial [Gammaproteobacteria bacterium]|nr:hypothetical protein [Gammaproteobacteria bacterium]